MRSTLRGCDIGSNIHLFMIGKIWTTSWWLNNVEKKITNPVNLDPITLLSWKWHFTHLPPKSRVSLASPDRKSGLYNYFLLDYLTVHLHSPNRRHLPAIRVVQRYCHWGPQNGRNSHWSCEPIMQWGIRQSEPVFRPTNQKGWLQPIGGRVLYPTDSPTATRLRLCSCLISSHPCSNCGEYCWVWRGLSPAGCDSELYESQHERGWAIHFL